MKTFATHFALILSVMLINFDSLSQKTWTGTVSEFDTNLPLQSASVYWEGTSIGAKTNTNGVFNIKDITQKSALVISYIGYEKMVIQPEELQKRSKLQIVLHKTIYQSDEVIVSATRAMENSAMAFSNLGQNDVVKLNSGLDVPLLLNFTPSLVTTTDAGAGIGYTGLRIRGTDATRINVTVNGIPINDSESQGVYWVNMPDLASSVSSIQIQRGVGTSINGAGAFGGSINIQSNEFNKKPYAEINSSAGSFNSFKNNIRIGTGLFNNNFTIDARLSKITSDGYVNRAFSNLGSYYLSGAYFGKKSFVRLITFGGKEKTYQSWNGVPEAALDTNRTYNSFTYPNQTDNYTQTHYQLLSTHILTSHLSLNANLHYTKGRGYYEEFKESQKLKNYGITDISKNIPTDLVRQKWLDNDFYGTTFSLDYQSFKRISGSIGGGINNYEGAHFGDIVSTNLYPTVKGYRWYNNFAEKSDFNIYGKANFAFSKKMNLYADLQLRKVGIRMDGKESKLLTINQNHNYSFFNPKFGLTCTFTDALSGYASFSIGQKEPNRTDFVDTQAIVGFLPKAEKLQDIEIGIKYNEGKMAFNANGYFMNYKNQLVITGAINDVGEPIRTNLPKSYRAGVELEMGYSFSKQVIWNINTTISTNKIEKFNELIPDYEGNYKESKLSNTDIAFSPNLILGSQFIVKPLKGLEIGLLSKYVGKQFLDNTSNEKRKLNAYFTNDLRMLYKLKIKHLAEVNLGGYLYNFLNEKYESNGYTFSYLYGGEVYTENYYYPQAGRNFMLSIGLKF